MYYIEKEAVYRHGTFWIGEDIREGIRVVDSLARNDRDDHHTWNLCLYEFDKGDDPNVVYSTNKSKSWKRLE